jgi:hypothetical protein
MAEDVGINAFLWTTKKREAVAKQKKTKQLRAEGNVVV